MNKLIPTESSIHSSAPPIPHVPSSSSHPIISFANTAVAIKKSETSRKIRTRARELSNMIETDVLSLDILELQPLTEYDVYMRSYGDNNTCQVTYSVFLHSSPFIYLSVCLFMSNSLSVCLSVCE